MIRDRQPKTLLGQRLTQVREALGFEKRKKLADLLDMHPETLGSYERGTREPDSQFYALYIKRFDVNINWLISGTGNMFNHEMSAADKLPSINIKIMMQIAVKVEDMVRDLKSTPSRAEPIALCADIYNNMVEDHIDFSDQDEVAAALALAIVKLKKRLVKTDI